MKYEAGSMGEKTVKSFTDLYAWQEAHSFVISVYTLVKTFPQEEQFGLSAQMRRAAVSVTSNIAEGFSRSTKADKSHFYIMAHGSLTELQNQLLIAKDVGYIQTAQFSKLAEQSVIVHKLLTGLIKVTKQRISHAS